MKISLTFIASFHHVKNWIISSAQDIFYLGLEQRSLISELIWRRHCLWKVHTSLNQTAKPALLLRAAWSGYKQFFDKQHQLREELEFKIFRKISVQTKSYSLQEKDKNFCSQKFLGLNGKIAIFLKMVSKIDFKTMNF